MELQAITEKKQGLGYIQSYYLTTQRKYFKSQLNKNDMIKIMNL